MTENELRRVTQRRTLNSNQSKITTSSNTFDLDIEKKNRKPTTKSPSIYPLALFLCGWRTIFALTNLVWDCDETYNYWEPMHMLAYGSGAQTWEYSPVYALRSYLYLLIHLLPVSPLIYLHTHGLPYPGLLSKISIFFAVRFVFGALLPAILESRLYYVLKAKLSPSYRNVHVYYLIFSLCSVGTWTSFSSLLPSSTCMLCVIYAYSEWLDNKLDRAVAAMGVAGLLCWSFALLLGTPILLDYAFLTSSKEGGGVLGLIKCLLLYGFLLLASLILVDSWFYGRWPVIASLNIVIYNVIAGNDKGPELYGSEPFTFYIKNLILNLSLSLPLAVMMPVLSFFFKAQHDDDATPRASIVCHRRVHLAYALGFLSWLAALGTRPHKEERFMYPIYPLMLLFAAVSLSQLGRRLMRHKFVASLCVNGVLFIHLALSLSRYAALLSNFAGSQAVFAELNKPSVKLGAASAHLWHMHDEHSTVNVCMGKEWHRFPSAFWLPADHEEQPGQRFRLRFVRSEFGAQLPGMFNESAHGIPYSTRLVDPLFNDANRHVAERLIEMRKCHFHVDTDTMTDLQFEKLHGASFRTVASAPFIDLAGDESSSVFRSFYVPSGFGGGRLLGRGQVKFTLFKLRARQY